MRVKLMKAKLMRTKRFLPVLALLVGTALAFASPAMALTKKEFTFLCKSGNTQGLRAALAQDQEFVNRPLDDDGETPLMKAAEKTWAPEIIQVLLAAGANVNAQDHDGETPLMYAMDSDDANIDIVKALLNAGASVNARDRKGRTPLMHALKEHARPEVINSLLDAGADVNIRDNKGRSALDYARWKGPVFDTDAMRRIEAASR